MLLTCLMSEQKATAASASKAFLRRRSFSGTIASTQVTCSSLYPRKRMKSSILLRWLRELDPGMHKALHNWARMEAEIVVILHYSMKVGRLIHSPFCCQLSTGPVPKRASVQETSTASRSVKVNSLRLPIW